MGKATSHISKVINQTLRAAYVTVSFIVGVVAMVTAWRLLYPSYFVILFQVSVINNSLKFQPTSKPHSDSNQLAIQAIAYSSSVLMYSERIVRGVMTWHHYKLYRLDPFKIKTDYS
jgi:hypothetical protein